MFFFGSNSSEKASRKKKLKKLKKKEYEAYCRRQHLIIEARKSHERNRKTVHKSKGGWGSTATMEEENIGFAVAEGFNKTVAMGGAAVAKIKARKKSLDKSRKTHLDKLKKARAKAQTRQRG